MRAFTTGMFTDRDRRAMHQQTMRHDNDRYRAADTKFWLEHELRVYPGITLDLDRLAEQADHIVPAAGAESRDHPTHRAGQALAQRLDRPLTELPGGHIGRLTDPAAFADALATVYGPA